MKLKSQKKLWETLAKYDPMWAILTEEEKRNNKWNPEEFFQTGVHEIQSLMTELDVLKISVEKTRALDFGCGIGRLTQALAEYFDSVIGVDISPEMINIANSLNKYPNNCKYVLNETSDLSQFTSNSFDLIYSNIVLQHIKPKISENYIREFVRLAKPSGIIVFQIPYSIIFRRRIQWRRRLFVLIQTLGLNGSILVKKFGLNPMRMASIPIKKVEAILNYSNATIIDKKTWSDNGISSCRYIAIKS